MIVYKYRLAAPHEGGDIVLAQMRLAHIYRNKPGMSGGAAVKQSGGDGAGTMADDDFE